MTRRFTRGLGPTGPARALTRTPMPRLVLALVLALAVSGCGETISADQSIEKAQEHIAAGDVRAGVIEFKNAIQQDPEDATARLLLGRTYLMLGDPEGAEKELARARELGAPPEAVLIPLAQAWNELGRHARVLEEVTPEAPEEIAAETAPETAGTARRFRLDALAARGQAHMGLQDWDAARRAFDAALAADADHAPALVGLAQLALSQGTPEQETVETVRSLVERARAAAPEDPDVLAMVGDLAIAMGEPAAAVAAFEQRAALVPENLGYKVPIAQARIAGGEPEAAIAVLDEVLKQAPGHAQVNYLRALAAYQTGDFEAAKLHGEKVLGRVPDHLGALMIVGGAQFARGENEQAVARLRPFVARVPQHEPARRVLGEALLRVGDPAGARQVLQPLVDENKEDAQLLAMVGAAALQAGDLEDSKASFQRLAAAQPDNAAARAQLGLVRLDLGEVEEGLADLEASAERNPDTRSLAVLAAGYIRTGKLDEALEVAERLAQEHPDLAVGPTVAGIVHVWKDEPGQARAAFREARRRDPDAVGAALNLAILEARQGDLDAALQLLTEALQDNPEDPRVLQRLGEVEAQMGRLDQAAARFAEVVALRPDDVQSKLSLARVHLQAGEPRKALDLTRRLLPTHPDDFRLVEVAGRAHLALEQTDQAVRVLRSFVEAHPEAVEPRLALAQALVGAGERDTATAQLEQALELEPQNVRARLALARLVNAEGDPERARGILAELDGAADNPRVLELRGDIAATEEEFADAVDAYRAAFGQEPTSERAVKLAVVQRRAGNPDYRSTLESWLAEHPGDVTARLAMADANLAAQDYDAAREHYRRILQTAPDNVVVLNNLAWLLWNDGEAKAAVPHIEKALELAPESPQVLDTAGVIFLAAGDVQRAVNLLTAAAEKSADASIGYHLAQALIEQGNVDEGRAMLERVLAEHAAFPERKEAEALLAAPGS